MSGTNDYQLYAGGAGANVITQAQYLALTSILSNGMSSGIVPSNQLNKILRQLSMGSAALGQIIANNNVNAVDDGNVSNFVSQLLAALTVLLAVPGFATNAEAQAQTSTTKALSPATLATALQGSNQSLSTNGYQKLPGGLILQWGVRNNDGTAGNVSMTFPIAFPTSCLNVSITGVAESMVTSDIFAISSGTISNSGFSVYGSNNADGAALMRFNWMAIGK